MKLEFPIPFKHEHAPVRNVNELIEERLTAGQRASDFVARTVGSWSFIIAQSGLLLIWAALNVTAYVRHWDPYPFILMNLVLSLQAAYTAPMIMMSQNRKADRDRIEAHQDFVVDQKAEIEIRAIMNHLVAQDVALAEIHNRLVTRPERESGAIKAVDPPSNT